MGRSGPMRNVLSGARVGRFHTRCGQFNKTVEGVRESRKFEGSRRTAKVGGLMLGAAALSVSGWVLMGANESSCQSPSEFTRSFVHDRTASAATFGPNFIADAVEKSIPALVNISAVQHGPWGQMVQSAGSGFVIRPDGLIVTNAHVVKGARKLNITLNDGRHYKAKIYAMDQLSDIALVIVEDPLEEPLPTVEIGDSSSLRAGEFVIALGSPLNMQNTVTLGVVSSVARNGSELGVPQSRTDYLQTDAAINQGNSGGPLVRASTGKVVGINTMKAAWTDGMGFSIPMSTASNIIDQLIQNRKVVRAYLGLRMAPLQKNQCSFERRINKNFPDVEGGLLVVKVAPGSPAEKCGLKEGDVIVQFGDKPVKAVADVTSAIGYDIGKTYEISVVRPGNIKKELYITSQGLDF